MIYFIFLLTFGVFNFTAFPSVAIYRDAGEMASVCYTFGIAHPPGYPLYVLLGKIFTLLIPFGNIAYRINLMSAFFGALSCGVLYLIVKKIAGQNEKIRSSSVYLCGFIAALTLAFSKTFWSVSLVAEMYTLNIFFIALLIYLLITRPCISVGLLAAFLLGLAMGNRIDIVLIAPGVLYWLFINKEIKFHPFAIPTLYALLFFIGFSVYLFLPVRSKTQPYLNWNKPDNIQTLVDTITRKTHGKTLDLISTRYTIGEVFPSEMKVYLKRTYNLFTYVGIPFMLLGFLYLYGKNRRFLVSTFLIYFISGPVFIAIAKMPPNPHALAIMEPHYLISDLILVLWFGCGIYYISEKLKKFSPVLLLIPAGLFVLNLHSQNMRFNFTAYDFARNVFRSIPKNSIIISREDIQVFSQWYLQFAEKKRSDITVIAKGLSGSIWYQDGLKKYNNTDVVSLNNSETFSQFYAINKNRNIYFTGDVEDYEMLGQKFFAYPYWLVFNVKEQKTTDYKPFDFEDIYIIRKKLNPELYPDFFSQKIVSQYADSLLRCGIFFMREGNTDKAIVNLEKSISMKTDTPAAYFNLGWIYFQKNEFEKTEQYYRLAIKFYNKLHKEAIEYKSFPEVVDSIISDWAVTYNNLGTIYEKQNKLNEAISEYEKAVEIKPDYADANYNMAVAYWRLKNWPKVIENLEKVLRINPNHADAQKYLFFARKNAGI